MTTTGLLSIGAAEIFDPKTQSLIGYVYTIAQGQGQLQRWLLFQNPHNQLEIRPPSAEMARWTLEDWQSNVAKLWRADGYYVWAQADVYEYRNAYAGVVWNEIPTADYLPKASFPDRLGSNFQLDYLDGLVIDVMQEELNGRAYVVRGLSDESSIEYWLLPERRAAAGESRMTVSIGRETAATLDDFVHLCQSSWKPGSSFVVTGCLNYKGEAPPFAP